MGKDVPQWTKFCGENAISHATYDRLEECPVCGAQNPKFQISTVIEIPDDSPQPKALLTGTKVVRAPSMQSSSRFASYDQRDVAERTRQTSMQNVRSSNLSHRGSQSKMTDYIRANVQLWLRRYRKSEDDDIFTETQTEIQNLAKTTVRLKNAVIDDLDDFIHNHLLKEIQRWQDITQRTDDRLYLATAVHLRDGPIQLPVSANELRTIKEVLDYFPKECMIHIVLEREDHRSYEDDMKEFISGKSKSLKQESFIKQEPQIKEEKKKSKSTKQKRPPSDSYESSSTLRVKKEPVSSVRSKTKISSPISQTKIEPLSPFHQRTTSQSSEELPELEDLHTGLSYGEKEEEKIVTDIIGSEDDSLSGPPARRTRHAAAREGKRLE